MCNVLFVAATRKFFVPLSRLSFFIFRRKSKLSPSVYFEIPLPLLCGRVLREKILDIEMLNLFMKIQSLKVKLFLQSKCPLRVNPFVNL